MLLYLFKIKTIYSSLDITVVINIFVQVLYLAFVQVHQFPSFLILLANRSIVDNELLVSCHYCYRSHTLLLIVIDIDNDCYQLSATSIMNIIDINNDCYQLSSTSITIIGARKQKVNM
jgi:hypothetical protein